MFDTAVLGVTGQSAHSSHNAVGATGQDQRTPFFSRSGGNAFARGRNLRWRQPGDLKIPDRRRGLRSEVFTIRASIPSFASKRAACAQSSGILRGDGRFDPVLIEFLRRLCAAHRNDAHPRLRQRRPRPRIITLPLLPFRQLSPQPQNEYFSGA
jgi:hypothetical protein